MEQKDLPESLEEARKTEIQQFEELKNKEHRTPEEEEQMNVLKDFLELTNPEAGGPKLPSKQDIEIARQKIEELAKGPPKGSDLEETYRWLDSLKRKEK